MPQKLSMYALALCLVFTGLTSCTSVPQKKACDATTCSGCCDPTGTCKSGFELSFCGSLGNSCSACLGAQQCIGGLCQLPQSNGGGSQSGGGTATGGGSANGGGTSTGGGSDTGGGSGQICGSCSGATPICDVSTNFCVGCLTNAHCSGSTPACNTFTKTCVPCTSNVHCTGATPICDTTVSKCSVCSPTQGCSGATPACDNSVPGGQCVACTSNANCGGATPVCDTGTKTCRTCTTGQGCSGSTPVCDTSVTNGRCVSCLANSHCSGTTPVCKTSAQQCVACLTSADCSGATPACDTATNTCVRCITGSGCSGSTPVCNVDVPGGQCVQCLNSGTCATSFPSTPVCDGTTKSCVRCTATAGCSGSTPTCDTTVTGGQCVQCLGNATCATSFPSTPVCNTSTKTCATCNATTGCSGATPTCDTSVGTGQCVQCLSNATCSTSFPSTPVCNTSTKSCVRCTASSGCSGSTPTCDTSVTGGQCVGCLSNANCSSPNSQCLSSTRTCVQCLSNANCSGNTVCDTAGAYTCVQCLTNASCSNPTPICNASKQCSGCTSTSQCSASQSCASGSCLANSESCTAPTLLTVAGTMLNFRADTTNALNDVSTTCGGSSGPDLVYRLNVATARDVTVSISPATPGWNPLLAVRQTNCTSGTTLACADAASIGGNETLTLHNVTGDLFIIVDSTSSTGGAGDVSIVLNPPTPPPANDTCAGAIALTFTGFNANTTGTIVAANNGNLVTDASPSCNTRAKTDGQDVFYKFTLAQAQDANISVISNTTSYQPTFYVRRLTDCADGSIGAEVGCAPPLTTSTAGKRFYGLTAGDYAIIVDSANGGEGTFDLGVTLLPPTLPPANDSCSAPQALTFDGNDRATATGSLVLANNSNLAADPSPTCSSAAKTTGRDVVYSFTLVSTSSVVVTVAPTGTPTFTPVVYVRRLTDCANSASGAELGCVAQGNATFAALPAGDYVLWVDSTTAVDANFNLTVQRAAAPANDLCTAPATLNFTNSVAFAAGTTLAATGQYQSTFSCGSNSSASSPDLVYSFTTALSTQVAVAVTPTDSAFRPVVYSGTACPAASTGPCASSPLLPAANAPVGIIVNPSTGAPNLIYVDGNGNSGAFRLNARVGAPPNEVCASATPIPASTVSVDNSIVEANTLAVNDYASLCGNTTRYAGSELVYAFTAPATATYTVTVTPDENFDPSLAILDAACTTATCLANVDTGSAGDAETFTLSATQGTVYNVVVDGYGGDTGFFRLDIR